MKTGTFRRSTLQGAEVFYGKGLPEEIQEMKETGKFEGVTAPEIFTKRSDGVKAAYDIRHNKLAEACDAVALANKTFNEMKMAEQRAVDESENVSGESAE